MEDLQGSLSRISIKYSEFPLFLREDCNSRVGGLNQSDVGSLSRSSAVSHIRHSMDLDTNPREATVTECLGSFNLVICNLVLQNKR